MRLLIRALVVAAFAILSGCGSSGGTVPRTLPLARIATSASPQPLIFVGMSVNGRSGVGEFRRSANGNVKPVRTIAFADTVVSLFGADSSNNFWVLFRQRGTYDPPTLYATRFSQTFRALGTLSASELSSVSVDKRGNLYAVVDNTIVEYAAGTYGKKTLRTIPIYNLDTTPQLAVDGAGNLYASGYPGTYVSSQYQIAEWGRKASGSVKPKREIPTGSAAPSALLADAAGDVYATFGAGTYSFANGVWEWPAGSTTPQWLLPGLPVKAFALDSAGNVYADVPTIENNFAIEVFSAARTPVATISGTRTRLGYPTGIAVTPN